jgi:hypothetical protein
MTRIVVSFLVALAASSLAGCLDASSSGVDACNVDVDCLAVGEVCGLDGKCRLPSEQAGAHCLRDVECSSARICDEGFDGELRCINSGPLLHCETLDACGFGLLCRAAEAKLATTCLAAAAPQGFCAATADCQDGLVCDRGRCGVPAGGGCDPQHQPADCVQGSVCEGGQCRVQADLGGPCAYDAQCLTPETSQQAQCWSGVCVLGPSSPCRATTRCAPDYACRPTAQGPLCLPLGLAAEACLPDVGGCVPGLACINPALGLESPDGITGFHRCHVPTGKSCADFDDDACQEGAVCRPDAQGELVCGKPARALDPCAEDDDCIVGTVCGAAQTCKLKTSEQCENSSQCLENQFCVVESDGVSRCRPPGSLFAPCQSAVHCTAPLLCDPEAQACRLADGATCWPAAPAGCLTASVCWQGTAKCEERKENGEQCSDNIRCASGICLAAGICSEKRLAAGASCLLDSDCQSSSCLANHTCK